MELLITSFIAGVLTILAPCVLPLLPVIVGGSVGERKPSKMTPIVITASLAASIVLFTLLLRASTVLIDVPAEFWRAVSGGIILAFGLITLFPDIWERFAAKIGLNTKSNKLLGKFALGGVGHSRNILVGAALGPVFTSCSPTFAIILATVLPVSFAQGFVYLIAYALGLSIVLLGLAFAGQKLAHRLEWASDPKGVFKRVLGVIFIVVGLAVVTGFDKTIETWLLDQGVYDGISELELNLFN